MEIALLEKSGSKLASLLASVLGLPAQKSIMGTGSYTSKHVFDVRLNACTKTMQCLW